MVKPIQQKVDDVAVIRAEDAVLCRYNWVISMEIDDDSYYISHIMKQLERKGFADD